jgi:hypothetical protein
MKYHLAVILWDLNGMMDFKMAIVNMSKIHHNIRNQEEGRLKRVVHQV